jgi:hypothetical protein
VYAAGSAVCGRGLPVGMLQIIGLVAQKHNPGSIFLLDLAADYCCSQEDK